MSKMIINKYGDQVWLNESGQYHRVDGPARIWTTGYKSWYINGKCHRLNGPAIIFPDGTQAWCIDGMYHRLDGPAFIHPNGSQAWWINGVCIDNHVIHEWITQMKIGPDYTKWTDNEKMWFKLRFT